MRRSIVQGGLGGRLPVRGLAAFVKADPNSIVLSQADAGAGFISAVLQNNAVASGLPNTGCSWSVPARDVFGKAGSVDIQSLLSAVSVLTLDDNPPGVDVCVGAMLADDVAATAQHGFGVRLDRTAGPDWLINHVTCIAGAYAATAAIAASASAVAGRATAVHTSSANQRRVQACALDVNQNELLTANVATAGSLAIIGNALDTLILWVGWILGGGAGTNGTVVTVKGYESILRLQNLSGYQRTAGPL